MAKNPPWTPAEDTRLEALVLVGTSYRDAAEQLGRTEEACRGRMVTLRKRRQPPPPSVPTRPCLNCLEPFPKVVNIFICTPCKKTPAWASADAFA